MPIVLVSLVDAERQWFKSCVGLDVSETGRDASFCAWTLLPSTPKVLVVEDATKHELFKDNPLVTGPPHINVRSHAPHKAKAPARKPVLRVLTDAPQLGTRTISPIFPPPARTASPLGSGLGSAAPPLPRQTVLTAAAGASAVLRGGAAGCRGRADGLLVRDRLQGAKLHGSRH